MKHATWLKITQRVYHVMHICRTLVLSDLDARFEPQCHKKYLLIALSCLLHAGGIAKMQWHTWDPKKGCKNPTRRPSPMMITYN